MRLDKVVLDSLGPPRVGYSCSSILSGLDSLAERPVHPLGVGALGAVSGHNEMQDSDVAPLVTRDNGVASDW